MRSMRKHRWQHRDTPGRESARLARFSAEPAAGATSRRVEHAQAQPSVGSRGAWKASIYCELPEFVLQP